MRKLLLGFILLATILLNGCSFIEGINNTINYADEATEHIERLIVFGEEAPQLIKDAQNDPEIKQQLQNKLEDLKTNIAKFNQLDAPAIAKDVHKKLIDKNEEIETAINEAIENGQLSIEKIKNSQIFKLINDVNRLLNQIEQLGL